ncbi:hypothetical protein EJ02DRAFT_200368 [Clathrospora elynae]|uniref:DUF6697 domain-containing protein n=1 Tax=Clathrospora elynae TaxID=706981 RepID=A0A6A5TDH1_9PLEO|nr:hypothetical protein EJ02DRAFT_200368 [Clathrospora elynae]
MSNRDPNIYWRIYTPSFDMDYPFNPVANHFAPNGTRENGTANQVNTPSSPYLEARVLNLEEERATLLGEVDTLKELYHGLSFSVDKLKKDGWPVHVSPFQDVDVKKSHQNAVQFSVELERLKDEVYMSVESDADVKKVNIKKSIPPHLRGKKPVLTNGNGTQERFVKITPDDPLATDGQVDFGYKQVLGANPTPPKSPKTVVHDDLLSVEALSLDQKAWKPHYLTTLPAFTGEIPVGNSMTTFHPAFLDQHFGGDPWSPGLQFVHTPGPCMLKNRTYYRIDPDNEPFLPEAPGNHGAKLTAFFNTAPEEACADLLDPDSNSYENVPMFVRVGNRYVYYGNYSQTRWSDKLDIDTMTARVPQHVKQYWAEDLTATTRQNWVTEGLKKHFFPRPEYNGRLFASPENATTVDTEEEVKLTEKMVKDVGNYVESLRQWEREAKMKTALIKKQFILDAFNTADAADPPALRLWWEYLECVDWRKDFYDMICQLQSREEQYA